MAEIWDLETVVKKAQSGDEAAYEELVRKYQKLIYFIVAQRVNNEADALDIVQETFIEVKKSIHNVKEPKYFKAWLNRVALSKISRHYEKRKDRTMNQNEWNDLYCLHEDRVYMQPEKNSHNHNSKLLLDRCMDELKPIYQEVLVLQYFKELSISEISHHLHIPEGTVKSRLNVAKKELKVIIEQMESREQIKLDFYCEGSEALLLAAVMGKSKLPVLIGERLKSVFHHTKSHPVLTPVVVFSVFMACEIGVQSLSDGRVVEGANETVEQNESRPFPYVTYQGARVENARAAYQIMYESAFIDHAFKNKQELKNVYDTLISYGGAYADMAQHIHPYLDF